MALSHRFLSLASIFLALIPALASPASATVIYEYTGSTFVFLNPAGGSSYSFDDRITGSFTFADRLPGNLELADLTPLVLDFTLSDGLQTYDPSTVLATQEFVATTDAAGNITEWFLNYEINPNDTVIASCGAPGFMVPGFPCPTPVDAGFLTSTDNALTFSLGEWRIVPEPGPGTLVALGLAGLGLPASRRRRA